MLPATSPAGSSKTPTPSPAAGPGSVGRCERPECHERDGGKREGGREGGWIRVRCIRGKMEREMARGKGMGIGMKNKIKEEDGCSR